MLGMHGTRAANYAMDEADLIVAIGARFDDRITGKLSEFAPRAKFIHIDIDPAEISKNVPAHIPIVGDAKRILGAPRGRVPGAGARQRAAHRLVGADRALALRSTRSSTTDSRGQRDQAAVPRRVALQGDQQRRLHPVAPTSASTRCGRRSTSTSTSRAAGSTPAGSGRWASACRPRSAPRSPCPDVPSVLLTGDGSFQMNIQELAHRAPVRRAGQVRDHGQRLPRHGPPVAGAVLGPPLLQRGHGRAAPDWVKLADAYGATGILLTDKTTLVDDLRDRARHPRPGRGRREGHARGEHVPDDRAGRRRARNGGLSHG